MHDETLRFLTAEPVSILRAPGRVWSLEGTCSVGDAVVWVQCYGINDPQVIDASALVFCFPIYGGMRQKLWFGEGLHFPYGLVVRLSAGEFDDEPLGAVPAGLELRVQYRKDTEIAQEAAARARWERRDDPHVVVVSLPEFLRTGILGPIRLGMARTEVLDTLGKPDTWSGAETPAGLPAIFKYGDIEFYFDYDDETLTCLRSDNFKILGGGEALRFDPWILRRGTPLYVVAAELAVHGIVYYPLCKRFDPDTLYITTGAGVDLGFEPLADQPEASGLHLFSLDAHRHWR